MGYKNREIEKKFVTPNTTLDTATSQIKGIIEYKSEISEASRDLYWQSPEAGKVDFIRLRYFPDGSGQLTIKHSDRGSNVNRVEIDVVVKDPDQAKKFLEYLYGDATGSIFKHYNVLFLDDDDHTTISIYRVRGDQRIFVEVEAKTQAKVDQLQRSIEKVMTLEHQTKSLYQLFVESKK